jgi:hypothetical protein
MSLNNVKVKVNQLNGHLQTSAPLSLRNAVRDFSVEDIENVVIINRVDGSGLQYNSETQNYEIKLMSLDGGNF